MFNGVLGSIFFTAYVEDILTASKFEYYILHITHYQPVHVSLNNALHCLYRLKTGCKLNVLEFFLTSYLRLTEAIAWRCSVKRCS